MRAWSSLASSMPPHPSVVTVAPIVRNRRAPAVEMGRSPALVSPGQPKARGDRSLGGSGLVSQTEPVPAASDCEIRQYTDSRRASAPRPAFDKGVRGFDFVDLSGGSEPTSPDRRERAGKHK